MLVMYYDLGGHIYWYFKERMLATPSIQIYWSRDFRFPPFNLISRFRGFLSPPSLIEIYWHTYTVQTTPKSITSFVEIARGSTNVLVNIYWMVVSANKLYYIYVSIMCSELSVWYPSCIHYVQWIICMIFIIW